MIAVACVVEADEPKISIDITTVTLDGDVQKTHVGTVPGEQFEQAVNRVVGTLESRKKRDSQLVEGTPARGPTSLPVTIAVGSLDTWVRIRRILENTPLIKNLQVKKMSRQHVEVNMTIAGSEQTLASALGAQGLNLTQRDGTTWKIKEITQT